MHFASCVSEIENPSAGTTYSVCALSNALVESGARVDLFSLGMAGRGTNFDFNDLRFRSDLKSIPILSKLGASSSMRQALLDSDADIFHIHGLWMLPNCYPAVAARARSKPLMLSPHGMLGKEALKFSNGKKRVAWALWQGSAARRVDCFLATCLAEYNEIREFGLTQPVAIIPNGVHLPPELPEARNSPPYRIVSLGRIHPKKGLDRLIRAWALVEHQYLDWHLDIVGPSENGHKEELERLCRQLMLQRVKFLAPVFAQEKWKLLSDAELFVLPSLNENFAMTVAESLVCETPVISTQGAPWAGLETNDCGWWIEHGEEPLVAALHKALSLNSQQRKAMGRRGRAWMMRDFSWGEISSQTLAVASWMIEGGDRPSFVRVD